VIAKGAGPDELLALALGLAADPGLGRIKERLRDAGSSRVMVVLQQFDQAASARTVSAAFEKMRTDQSVMAEWNKFLEQGTRAEEERVADAQGDGVGPTIPVGGAPTDEPSPFTVGNLEIIEPEPQAAAPAEGGQADLEMIPPPQPSVRLPRPSVIEEASSPEAWLGAFERSVKNKFQDHFGDVDWGYRFDKTTGTVTAGDPQGRSSMSISLPSGYLEQSAWLLAGKLLAELRKRAEDEGAVRKKR
jgi:hypothetical protein